MGALAVLQGITEQQTRGAQFSTQKLNALGFATGQVINFPQGGLLEQISNHLFKHIAVLAKVQSHQRETKHLHLARQQRQTTFCNSLHAVVIQRREQGIQIGQKISWACIGLGSALALSRLLKGGFQPFANCHTGAAQRFIHAVG